MKGRTAAIKTDPEVEWCNRVKRQIKTFLEENGRTVSNAEGRQVGIYIDRSKLDELGILIARVERYRLMDWPTQNRIGGHAGKEDT